MALYVEQDNFFMFQNKTNREIKKLEEKIDLIAKLNNLKTQEEEVEIKNKKTK